VYHGTASENVPSICRKGLRLGGKGPSVAKRTNESVFFGTTLAKGLSYCSSVLSLRASLGSGSALGVDVSSVHLVVVCAIVGHIASRCMVAYSNRTDTHLPIAIAVVKHQHVGSIWADSPFLVKLRNLCAGREQASLTQKPANAKERKAAAPKERKAAAPKEEEEIFRAQVYALNKLYRAREEASFAEFKQRQDAKRQEENAPPIADAADEATAADGPPAPAAPAAMPSAAAASKDTCIDGESIEAPAQAD